MRTGYDSVNPSAIPTAAAVVAGYIDSVHYTWPVAAWDRFRGAVHVRIATKASTNDGHVLDVEMGDATPAEAPGWVVRRRAAGADPTIYTSASQWAAVMAAFANAGVAHPQYWIAHYDGDPRIPYGAVAKQYVDPPNSGGDWDLSAVADHWPGVDQGGAVTGPVDLTDAALNAIAQRVANWGYVDPPTSNPNDRNWVLVRTTRDAVLALAAKLDVDVTALEQAEATDHAALLAAVKAVTGGTTTGVTDAQLAALETAITASVPPAVLGALVARLTTTPTK